MNEQDDVVRATLAELNSKAPTGATPDADLLAKVEAGQRAQIQRLRDYAKNHPDDAMVKANQHLLPKADGQAWAAVGNMGCTSFIWWALHGNIALQGGYGFSFSGKGGPNWTATSFGVVLMGGPFLVDPASIAGSPQCNFLVAEAGIGGGVMNMTFWGMDGTTWGTVGGPATGIGAGGITGTIQLTW